MAKLTRTFFAKGRRFRPGDYELSALPKPLPKSAVLTEAEKKELTKEPELPLVKK